MLATLGYIVADFVKLPGKFLFSSISITPLWTLFNEHLVAFPGDVHEVSSLGAHDVAVKSGALTQILIWTSVFEAISAIAVYQVFYLEHALT